MSDNFRHVVCARFACGCIAILCPASSAIEYVPADGCDTDHRPATPYTEQETTNG